MKPLQHTTDQEIRPSLQEIGRWPLALIQLYQRLAPSFARPEPRQHALLYLQAIVSEIPRKNSWQIAEHAKQARPYGMQRLLSRAIWDEEGVRDALRTFLLHCLSPPSLRHSGEQSPEVSPAPFPVLVMDESGFPKRGTHSAGVQKQYCGATGQVDTCQVGVFLSYVTAAGHALIDRELYLPEDWCTDAARRQAVHIPETVGFQTKPELAQRMVQRAQSASLPIRWVVADTVYGHSTDLRLWLEVQGYSYALAVPANEVVCIQTAQGAYRLGEVASLEQQELSAQDWQRLSMSQGTKGERLFDWAILPLVLHGTVDGCHWLVIRRCLDDPSEKAYYLVFALPGTSLHTMVLAIGARWSIEVDLENAKDLGLDQYEVRSYVGWYRHMTLVMLAAAFLLSICVQDSSHACQPEEPVPSSPLIPLTVSEVRHVLARLTWPAPSSAPLICQWSRWRRAHQYWAGYYHRRRRLKAG
jgi:SRSO17 transposase